MMSPADLGREHGIPDLHQRGFEPCELVRFSLEQSSERRELDVSALESAVGKQERHFSDPNVALPLLCHEHELARIRRPVLAPIVSGVEMLDGESCAP